MQKDNNNMAIRITLAANLECKYNFIWIIN